MTDQEVTTDLPRLTVSPSLQHRVFTGSPVTDGVKAAEGGPGLSPILTSTVTEERCTATLATRAQESSAALRPVSPERRSRCTLKRQPSRGSHLGGHIWSQCNLRWPANGRFWGQLGRLQKQQEEEVEEEKESRPFQRRSPGDASVNARAMSRRKQGNPQHLSQREITCKYTCKSSQRHIRLSFPVSVVVFRS